MSAAGAVVVLTAPAAGGGSADAVAGKPGDGQPVELLRSPAEVDRMPGVRDEVLGLAGPGVGGAVRGRPAEHHVVAAQDVQHGQLGLLAARLPAVPGRGRRPAARPQCAQLAAGQGVLGRLLAAGDGAFVRARVVEGLGAAARDGGEVALCPRLPGEPRIVRGGREREQALVTGFVVAGFVVTALVVRAACTLVLVVGVQRYPADDDGVDATALGGTL